MSLSAKDKAQIVEKYQRKAGDTGSVEVQVALWTSSINILTEHLKLHPKDFHSRRGLIKMVNNRRKLLNYLKEKDYDRYMRLITDLGIRR